MFQYHPPLQKGDRGGFPMPDMISANLGSPHVPASGGPASPTGRGIQKIIFRKSPIFDPECQFANVLFINQLDTLCVLRVFALNTEFRNPDTENSHPSRPAADNATAYVPSTHTMFKNQDI